MKRSKVPKKKDKRIFAQTAGKTKILNTGKIKMRGGIRL